MKKLRLVFASLLLAGLVGVAAGCGGGGSNNSVPTDAVALVGTQSIPKSQFDELMTAAQGEDQAKGQTFPKVGSTAYTTLRAQAVEYLVQAAEFEQEGKKLGVTVTQKDVTARIAQLRQQYGGQKKFDDALKSSGLTMAQLELLQRLNLIGSNLYAKVTSSAKVSKSAAKKYYDQHKSSYTTQAETTRSVRHILLSSKSEAELIETKLKNGQSFASLAKRYSKDTGSAQQGGKLTAVKGQLVAPFQNVAFKLKTGAISQPVHSKYGWHVIQALGPVKHTPAHQTPFKQVASTIEQNLLQSKQTSLWTTYLATVTKDFTGKVSYQTGYAPPATTATTSTTTPTTTG